MTQTSWPPVWNMLREAKPGDAAVFGHDRMPLDLGFMSGTHSLPTDSISLRRRIVACRAPDVLGEDVLAEKASAWLEAYDPDDKAAVWILREG